MTTTIHQTESKVQAEAKMQADSEQLQQRQINIFMAQIRDAVFACQESIQQRQASLEEVEKFVANIKIAIDTAVVSFPAIQSSGLYKKIMQDVSGIESYVADERLAQDFFSDDIFLDQAVTAQTASSTSSTQSTTAPVLTLDEKKKQGDKVHKSKISVAQALLILIDNCKDKEDLILLKRLYLCGANKREDYVKISEILKFNPVLENYEVSSDPETINNDPTRRYFETHLAFNTLKDKIKYLKKRDLEFQTQAILNGFHPEDQSRINEIYDNKHISVDSGAKEYSDAIEKLQTNKHYAEFSKEDKVKLSILIKAAYAALHMTNQFKNIPLGEVYEEGYFLKENRGRIAKVEIKDEKNITSNNFGLMKSYMVVPGGHANTDVAYASMGFPSLRSADRSRFDPSAAWPVENFKGLVHPFSAAISGGFLAQLRVMAWLNDEGYLYFNNHEKMANYLTCFMAFFLYNSGGHSLNEFFGVLSIEKIKNHFKFIENFSEINVLNLFYEGNETAFDLALNSAINYNKMMLQRAELHRSLIKQPNFKKVDLSEKDQEFSFFGTVLPDEKKLSQPKGKSADKKLAKTLDRKKKNQPPLTQAEEKIRLIKKIQEGIQYYKSKVTKNLEKADFLFVMLQAFARLDLNNPHQTSLFLSRYVRFDSKETEGTEFRAALNKGMFDKFVSTIKFRKSPTNQSRVIHLITKVGDFINKYAEQPHLHDALPGLELSDSKVGDKKSVKKLDDQSVTIKALTKQYDRLGVADSSQHKNSTAETGKAPEPPLVQAQVPVAGSLC